METITLNHQDWKTFVTTNKRVAYRNKCLKRGPAFSLGLKNKAIEFCSQYLGWEFYLMVETQNYVTIWFESNRNSNFPYSS